MKINRMFFYYLPILHALVISRLVPYSPVVAVMLIINIGILSSYGIHCKGDVWSEVKLFTSLFGVWSSYRGAIMLYLAGLAYWSYDSVALKTACIVCAYVGSLIWFRLPFRCYTVIRRGKIR